MATTLEPSSPRAPSVSSLIAASTGPVENDGATALDDLRDELVATSALEDVADQVDTPAQLLKKIVKRRRRRKGTATRARDLRRRAKPGAAIPAGESGSRPTEENATPASKPPKKAELQQLLEQAQSDLASERARHDSDKIKELSTTLEMLSLVGYGMLAELWGAHWNLEQGEAHQFGETGAVALAPHAEKLTASLPWAAFLLTVVNINFKRVKIDRARALETGG